VDEATDEQPTDAQEWLELAVEVDAEAVEAVSEVFARHGYNEGVAVDQPFTQEADGDRLAVDVTRPFTVRTFVAASDVRPEALEEIRHALWYLGRLRQVGELRVTARRETEWADAWKEHYRPQRVGRRVVVRPPWFAYAPEGDDVVVVLDPGMAFGTGLHPSTRLSVLGLETELRSGMSVLDVGSGSGVLAIAAALLGAGFVAAVDIEPVAVRATRENAARNGVAERIAVAEGSAGPGGPVTGTYDLVLANIIARVLIELAADLAAATAPGGTLVLAGIIEGREAEVRAAFDALDLAFVRRAQEEDWVSLVYRQPTS
jgi:ribosomal protein L11 methyltransferase